MIDKKNVLAIDDDDNFTLLIEIAFKKLKLPVVLTTATSGQEGLQIMQNYGVPELLLLDLRMPVMDGFDVLAELEKKFPDQNYKVVVLSSSYRKEDRERAFKYKKVVEYVEKPMKLKGLHEIIGRFYNNHLKE